MSPLLYAVPVFLILAAAEAAYARRAGRTVHRLSDSFSNLSCGIADQLLNALAGGAFLFAYDRVQAGFGFWRIPASAWSWLALVLGIDFAYYLFHRASHRVGLLWAAHVVHHQSEEFNLTVALRQGAFESWGSYAFYLPLALIGFPLSSFLLVHAGFLAYQFLIHTRLVGTLGPLEWFLTTPSLHRVHHGRDLEYLDKNFGGFLNVWDRLFGTYQREFREPLYGITTGIKSWSPVWAHAHFFRELWARSREAGSRRDALLVWIMPPGWEGPTLPYRKESFVRYEPGAAAPWAWLPAAGVVAATLGLLLAGPQRLGLWFAAGAVIVVGAIQALAGIFDGKISTSEAN